MQKLWILSDRYGISTLQQLSLLKLHRDLCAFKLEHISAKVFIDMLEFAYSNTAVSRGEEKGECALRELVMATAVCHARILVENKAFLALLEGGGDLARDFGTGLAKRKT
jgi:hypothetical protein